MTAQQATPVVFETQQVALSLPYSSAVVKSRSPISNFDISPSFTTRRTFSRPIVSDRPKVMPDQYVINKTPLIENIPIVSDVVADIAKPLRRMRQVSHESRGLFNEFERASLLSYMQRRQLS